MVCMPKYRYRSSSTWTSVRVTRSSECAGRYSQVHICAWKCYQRGQCGRGYGAYVENLDLCSFSAAVCPCCLVISYTSELDPTTSLGSSPPLLWGVLWACASFPVSSGPRNSGCVCDPGFLLRLSWPPWLSLRSTPPVGCVPVIVLSRAS